MARKPKQDPESSRQRQIKFTPSDREAEIIARLAEWWRMPESKIIQMALHEQLSVYMQRVSQGEDFLSGTNRSEVNPLRLLLLRLAAGETIAESELTLLAHDCGVPIETLKQIRDCLMEDRQSVHSV